MARKRAPFVLTPVPDIPAIPEPPEKPLPRFRRSDVVAMSSSGPALLVSVAPEFLDALEEEARRQGMRLDQLVSDAILLVVAKGLDALVAVPDREEAGSTARPEATGEEADARDRIRRE